MNSKKRTDLSHQATTKEHKPLDPITSLTALVPLTDDPACGGEPPMPSGDGFARQFFRAWTKRLMILCAVGAVCLWASVPLLSRMRVDNIEISGQLHYSEAELKEALPIEIGSELLAVSLFDAQRALIEACPYLSTVKLERSLSGIIRVEVTERTPTWALVLSEDRVALLDEAMWVLELTGPDRAEGLCCVKMPLFSPSDEQKGEQADPTIESGMTYNGNPSAIAKLVALSQAMATLRLTESPMLIDMTDRYAISLRLSDGTTLALHECSMPTEQLKAGIGALQAYRAQHQNAGPMLVDVDNFSRVTLRPMQEIGK